MLITLVRHGESTGNIMQQWQGITDGPLTKKGLLQAELVSHALCNYKFSAIFSSPLSRALDTAKMIQRKLSTPCPGDIIINPLLMELNMGSMEQRSWNIPFQMDTRDTAFPKGGESLNDVLKRAFSVIDLLLLLFLNNNNNNKEEGHILLVSHGMFLTELIHALCIRCTYPWIDLAWSNTGITTIEINKEEEKKEKIRFICINDTQHLFI